METALPGLEREALTLEGLKPFSEHARKVARSQTIKAALAQRILGHAAKLEWSSGELAINETSPEEDAGPGESLRTRMAVLLMLSAEDENNAVGTFDGQDGETFGGAAVLWKSSLRLDPSWMEATRRRSRKIARERATSMWKAVLDNPKERDAISRNYDWKYRRVFLTLTMPHRAGATSVDEVRRFNRAWRILCKAEWWATKTPLYGGIKAIEDQLDEHGPHVHGHFLLISRWIDQDELHREWTIALEKATWELHKEKLSSIPALPYLKQIVRRLPNGKVARDFTSMEDAINEVCKYMTLSDDLITPHVNRRGDTVQPPTGDVLFELAMVKRWPRMFEMLGRARKTGAAKRPRPSLDTSCISAGAARVELPPFWEEGAIEPEEWVDFRLKIAEVSCLGVKIKRARPPSWRELMFTLPLSEWLQVVAARFRSGIRFRCNFLRAHNPSLSLITLNGDRIVSSVWPESAMI